MRTRAWEKSRQGGSAGMGQTFDGADHRPSVVSSRQMDGATRCCPSWGHSAPIASGFLSRILYKRRVDITYPRITLRSAP
jgi:hypothetical protein